jgi:hypothetical protein
MQEKMKNENVTKTLRSLAAVAAISSLTTMAHGAGVIIVEDNFDRPVLPGTDPLIGSNADTGQTWAGSSGGVTTGTEYLVFGTGSPTTSFATIGGLTFLPSSTYCLSVDMTIFLPISDGELGLGFFETGATSVSAGTVGTFQLTQVADVRSHPTNLTLPQIDPVSSTAFSTSHNLEIRLNTGATLASSTLEWWVDGSVVRSGVAVDASAIDGIFLAHDSTDGNFRGQFDRLRLEGPIPEPSAVMMLVLGGLGAAMRRRR